MIYPIFNKAVFTIDDIDISSNVETWTLKANALIYELSLSMSSFTFWSLCNPETNYGQLRIKAVFTVEDYAGHFESKTAYFLLEELSETVTVPGIDFEIWGRSAHALLMEPYAVTITDTAETEYEAGNTATHVWQNNDTTVSDLIDKLCTNYAPYLTTLFPGIPTSTVIKWNVADFNIYAGTLGCSNTTAIGIISTLAEAIGAEITPLLFGNTLYSIDSYKVTAPSYIWTVESTETITGLSARVESTKGFNVVVVMGDNDVTEDTTDPENPIEENKPDSYLTIEIHPDQVDIITQPDEWHKLKVFYFHPNSSTPPITIFCEYTGFAYDHVGSYTETVTEDVFLQWGIGSTSKPDTNGNNTVRVPADGLKMFSSVSCSYTRKFHVYNVKGSVEGTCKLGMFFPDYSADAAYEFEIVESGCDEDHLENCDEAGCIEIGGVWINGECVLPGDPDYPENIQPWMKAVLLGEAPYYTQDTLTSVTVRVYFYHPDPTVAADPLGKMTAYNPGLLTPATGAHNPAVHYGISEVVQLQRGKGTTSMPDTTGNTVVDVPADYALPFSETIVSYNTYYRDFDLRSSTAGEYRIAIYFNDMSAETEVSVELEEYEAPPEPVYVTITLLVKNRQTQAIIPNAAVSIDGVSVGTTDSEGYITPSTQYIEGTSHTLTVTASGFISSDDDDIANGTFTV